MLKPAPKPWGVDNHPHDKVWEAEEALAGIIDLLYEAGRDGDVSPTRLAALLNHVRASLAVARDQLSSPSA